MFYNSYPEYVSVAQRRANAAREMQTLAKKGLKVDPVETQGRKIATTFWGKAWCDHIEILSDFASRLDKGKTYVRNGSVCHLEVTKGKVHAYVSGSELYEITIGIQPMPRADWKRIQDACAGQLTSAVELLQGKFSDATMRILTDPKAGMFPDADDFDTECDCPDFARLCKHLAAVLYGVGARLDRSPELLFVLRGVDPTELLSSATSFTATPTDANAAIADDQLADIFGIDLATESPAEPEAKTPPHEPRAAKPKPAKESKKKKSKPSARNAKPARSARKSS